jgi:hypothetical protein
MLDTQLPRNYPQVKAFLWFDETMDGMDWPIESSAVTELAFANGMQNSYYTSNQFGSASISPIPPP